MFTVLFEVHPRADRWDAYLAHAKRLKPELERTDGFVDNVRYRSMTREGWLLSLSSWRDEKALVRWRTHALHHAIQEKGRAEVFLDYHLRVGEVTLDTRPPEGHALRAQRLDETETGAGTAVTLVDAPRAPPAIAVAGAPEVAAWLGFAPGAAGLVAWDALEAVLTPGDMILLATWRDGAAAERFEGAGALPDGARLRRVRVVRDYGMYDRREAPQWFPDVARPAPPAGG